MMLLAAILTGVTVYLLTQGLGVSTVAQSSVLVRRRLGVRKGAVDSLRDFIRERVSAPIRQSVSFSEVAADPFALDLFMAGIRDNSRIVAIKAAAQLTWIVPSVACLLSLVVGTLTPRSFTLFAAIAAGGPLLLRRWVLECRRARQASIEQDLPQFLDLMMVCVEAGLNFTAALPVIVEQMGAKKPLTQEMREMHQEYLSGVPLAETAERAASRCGVASLSGILASIVQSQRMGSALGRTLRILSAEIRNARRLRLKEKANKIPTLIVFPSAIIFLETMIIAVAPSAYRLVQSLGQIGMGRS